MISISTPKWFKKAVLKMYMRWKLIGPLWRYVNGGIFIWRDTPDWMLEVIAKRYARANGADIADQELRGVLADAAAEWQLRQRRAAIAKAEEGGAA